MIMRSNKVANLRRKGKEDKKWKVRNSYHFKNNNINYYYFENDNYYVSNCKYFQTVLLL